jgi:very-short-patch-repair endonuclease
MKRAPPDGSTSRARQLRSNATDAERALWRLLREAFPEARFRRQVPIRNYIVDFASHRAKLVIEADGGQHNEEADADRTSVLKADGYRILRFWNNDILDNPEGVARHIAQYLRHAHPHPPTR